jgi:hypothetical protein
MATSNQTFPPHAADQPSLGSKQSCGALLDASSARSECSTFLLTSCPEDVCGVQNQRVSPAFTRKRSENVADMTLNRCTIEVYFYERFFLIFRCRLLIAEAIKVCSIFSLVPIDPHFHIFFS